MWDGRLRQMAGLVAVVVFVFGCRRSPMEARLWQVRFGPVIGNELIVGRVASGAAAWLLTSDALIKVDLDGRRFVRATLHPRSEDDHLWGLASIAGEEMWTLMGRSVLARISGDGEVLERIELSAPHVGLYSAGHELLYQALNFQPPVDALMAGPPGDGMRRVWGRMRTRPLPLARAAVAALNLVGCGPTVTGTVPCWFPDQAAVSLTDPSGASRELMLEGLPTVAAEVLLASDNPRRPIRDAFVSSAGDLWVLGSGRAPDGDESKRPGGWLLARYSADGRLMRRMQLPEPARLLLGTREESCLVLSWDGRVVEVRP